MRRAIKRMVLGSLWAIVALATYLWASQYSPHSLSLSGDGVSPWNATLGNRYIIDEPYYTALIVIAAAMAVAGLILIGLGTVDVARYMAAWKRIKKSIEESEPILAGALLGWRASEMQGAHGNALPEVFPRNVRFNEQTIAAVIEELQTPFVEIRRWAIKVLERLGPQAASAVPSLIETLGDKNGKVRCEATRALASIGEAAKPAIPALMATGASDWYRLHRKTMRRDVRFLLSISLVYMLLPVFLLIFLFLLLWDRRSPSEGAKKKPRSQWNEAEEAIWWIARGGEPEERDDSIEAYENYLKRRRELQRHWLNALDSPDVKIRRVVAMSFGQWIYQKYESDGRGAYLESLGVLVSFNCRTNELIDFESLVESLQRALKNEDEEVRIQATKALLKLINDIEKVKETSPALGKAEEAAVMALAAAMADRKKSVRRAAASALAWNDSNKRPPGSSNPIEAALPYLIAALSDKDQKVRSDAAYALRNIGPNATPSVPALIPCLKAKDRRVLNGTLAAFHGIGPGAKEAVPALIQLLKSPTCYLDPFLERSVSRILGRIGPEAADAVPLLNDALQGSRIFRRFCNVLMLKEIEAISAKWDDERREDVIRALGGIRHGAREAVPALIEELNKEDRFSRTKRVSAAWALGQIGLGTQETVSALVIVLNGRKPRRKSWGDEEEEDFPELRRTAAEALGLICRDPASRGATALRDAARNDDSTKVRQTAAEALKRMEDAAY